ncbi:very-long-chain (3R)-3-hydroxyacyl-CoA dehydratase like protein [Verticillium longisporum]|nr:very-long-chain (3R)-3-hydroxyacyl-CoA dehydratase like protein [Verticillium longisporum]
MLLAWSVTEVIRYSYFALTLSGLQPRVLVWLRYNTFFLLYPIGIASDGLQPKALVWLRYNTFFVLYPIGIASECALVYLAAEPAKAYGELVPYLSYAILAIYVPGSYILYTYMMKQRRKVMRSLKAEQIVGNT